MLNEDRLVEPLSERRLGYQNEDLAKNIHLEAGGTVIIAPATGNFGQAAVQVALAMGAGKVLEMGRNKDVLMDLSKQDSKISTVPVRDDVMVDTAALKSHGPFDVYSDISPPAAAKSMHLKPCIIALRPGGRVSLWEVFRRMWEFRMVW